MKTHSRLTQLSNKTVVLQTAGIFLLVLVALNLVPVRSVYAATFTVTKTADTNDGSCDTDCSLREAIGAANASAGADTITFDPSLNGTPITLSIAGNNEDFNATGDLDIRESVTINGNGARNTIINANGIDRVLHVAVSSGTYNINDLTLTGGDNNNNGGGLLIFFPFSGTTSLNRVMITNNRTSTGFGGGVYSVSTLNVSNSTISDNTAGGSGGGMYSDGGTVTIVNSTISGNSADINNGGGRFWDSATISHSTIVNNIADAENNGSGDGGGLGGNVTLRNSVIANNIDMGGQAPDCGGGGTRTSADYNLIEDTTGCGITLQAHDIAGVDPALGILQNNGGSTDTHALSIGSQALNAIPNGSNGCGTAYTNDQRGIPRPQGAACDIGAFEYVTAVTPSASGGNGPGGVGVTDGSTTLEIWYGADLGAFTDIACTAGNEAGDGSAVACWQDQSGNGHHATLGTVGQQPIFRANRRNSVYNLPALEFDGSSDRLATLPLQLHATGNSGLSMFSVFDTDTNTSQRFLVAKGISAQCTDELELGIRAGSTPNGAYGIHRGCANATYAGGGTIANNTYYLMSALALPVGNTPANVNIFRNSSALAVANNNTGWVNAGSYSTAVEQLNIGARQDNNATNYTAFHDGDATEIIVFTTDLNNVQRILVENYLSAKYEIDISGSGNDHYDGDDNGNGDFDLDVAGIGRLGGNQHTQAFGAGMIVVDNSFLNDDGDWLLFGHNTAVNANTTDHIPAGIEQRWARSFYINLTDANANGGTVDIIFDFSEGDMGAPLPAGSASNYRLLKRSDPTNPAEDFTDIAQASVIVGDQVQFLGVNVADLGSDFTLGTVDAVTSPTAVSLQSFSATTQTGLLVGLVVGLLLAVGTVMLRRRQR